MREELAAVLAAAQESGSGHVEAETVAGRRFLRTEIAGRDVVLTLSGIGKVAAAATAALLCERADAVLMVGTAGGLGAGVEPGDVVVARELLQHDVDARPLAPRWVMPDWSVERLLADARLTAALEAAADDVVARRPGGVARRHAGLVVSGDLFVATADASARLRADLPDVLAVEMEGAALAQVCIEAGVPFGVARTVSDRADAAAHGDFRAFLTDVAAPYAHDLVLATLARL
ncbi:5'-methylthioadenosine/adenosylhomocysteine nucleosidase [Xylanimonas protaetiae]|uniref:adenosylhomocysteine nucleosidase n=2 Tax=Xylanimonas protaetiae TaxID=2509457 RepID=A0A4P6FAC0_9MICO|nr:5'-methylthioadenosine/adenosylhomocysteine nucleosidase [Xylanimonas protaetiae]